MSHDASTDQERTAAVISSPAVLWLVALLAGTHFLQWTVVMPEDAQRLLAFHRGDVEGARWWTVATYSLVQPSVTMLVLNAYALLLFGPRLERFWGAKRFIGFAVLAALGGWVVHQFIGGTSALLGASAIA